MGRSQRAKGAAGERQFCSLLNEHLGCETKRNLMQTREGGCDTWLRIAGMACAIEIKRVERLQLRAAVDQVLAVDADMHAVAHRTNGKPWLVTMPIESWVRLVREAGVE